MSLPFIPGHEAAGTIVAINPNTATSFKIGDKVTFKTLIIAVTAISVIKVLIISV